MTPQEIADRIEEIRSGLESDLDALHGTEALQAVTTAQRDLRDLKRMITDDKREVRLAATAERQKTTERAQTAAMFGKTAKSMGRQSAAIRRNDISQQQTRTMAAYSPLESEIGEMVAQLDRVKEAIKSGQSPHLEPTNAQLARAATAEAAAQPVPPKSPVKALVWAIIWLVIALVLLFGVKGLFGGLVGAVLLVVGLVGLVIALVRWSATKKGTPSA